jgi:hypothetical protein
MALRKTSLVKKAIIATKKKRLTPRKSKDVPVTQEMLNEVRSELKHSIVSLDLKMGTQFEKVLAEVHRVGLLVEEQNSRNRFVLDGYASLDERMGRLEQGK